jgi:hypothetical protein
MKLKRIAGVGLTIAVLVGAQSAEAAKPGGSTAHPSLDGQLTSWSKVGDSPLHALKVFGANEGLAPRSPGKGRTAN